MDSNIHVTCFPKYICKTFENTCEFRTTKNKNKNTRVRSDQMVQLPEAWCGVMVTVNTNYNIISHWSFVRVCSAEGAYKNGLMQKYGEVLRFEKKLSVSLCLWSKMQAKKLLPRGNRTGHEMNTDYHYQRRTGGKTFICVKKQSV
jgi:hypothetical protein